MLRAWVCGWPLLPQSQVILLVSSTLIISSVILIIVRDEIIVEQFISCLFTGYCRSLSALKWLQLMMQLIHMSLSRATSCQKTSVDHLTAVTLQLWVCQHLVCRWLAISLSATIPRSSRPVSWQQVMLVVHKFCVVVTPVSVGISSLHSCGNSAEIACTSEW